MIVLIPFDCSLENILTIEDLVEIIAMKNFVQLCWCLEIH